MMLQQINIYMKKNLDFYLTSFIKLNSNWIIDLNVRLKSKKLSEEKKLVKIFMNLG